MRRTLPWPVLLLSLCLSLCVAACDDGGDGDSADDSADDDAVDDDDDTGDDDDCGRDAEGVWAPLALADAPEARTLHTAVWTGDAMIVWGGIGADVWRGPFNTGGSYDPSSDAWSPTSTDETPWARLDHVAVWTGDRMLVWGGGNEEGDYQSQWRQGGLYDPADDRWTLMTIDDAPPGRGDAVAVWTGQEMIVWGGGNELPPGLVDTGGLYDPDADRWTATSAVGAPSGRFSHAGVWTGDELIVWGGFDEESNISSDSDTGGVYDPESDSWRSTSLVDVPTGRREHTAVWTGTEMIVWGGISGEEFLDSGARYDPLSDAWMPIAEDCAPSPRVRHTAVWTGDEMIVWGGDSALPYAPLGDGGIYDPVADRWTPLPTEDASAPRSGHTAVWTGSAMIIWGGWDAETPLASGASYQR